LIFTFTILYIVEVIYYRKSIYFSIQGERMNEVKNAKRVIIKVGTSTLTYESGSLNIRRVEKLVKVISDLKNEGREIILVSSGAIGVGMGKIGISTKPEKIEQKQALAAIGQCELMNFYDRLFGNYNHTIAQILITKSVVEQDELYKNAKNTFETLLKLGILPIVNENDTISTEQIEFGDNDTLSAYVTELTRADLLIILSDIDGLYDRDPREDPNAAIIHEVKCITDDIKAIAGGAGSRRGTGGMITKIKAAEIANNAGSDMIIANGYDPDVLYDIFEGKQIGTLFRKRTGEL
jgi:glutamate 5-kinase